MSLGVYSWVALPLWACCFALYFILRGKRELARQSLIAKCAGSFLAVGSCGIALYLKGQPPFLQPVFWFFLLCTAADALLELQFVLGMLLFGAGHICLLVWLFGIASPTLWSLVLWAAAYALTALLFRRELPGLKGALLPFLLYPAILCATLALSLPLPFLMGWKFTPAALGALCFFISDLMVAKEQLSGGYSRYQKPIMLLYWGALYLFSASIWLI